MNARSVGEFVARLEREGEALRYALVRIMAEQKYSPHATALLLNGCYRQFGIDRPAEWNESDVRAILDAPAKETNQ